MVYVSLDVEKLLKFVSSLQGWGDKAMQESDEIKKLNEHWDPPAVKSIGSDTNPGDPTSGDASGLASVRSLGDYLSRIIATDLKRRCKEAQQMNSDGILTKTPEGRLTYFLPDDAEDTAVNVEKNNTEAAKKAKQDAAELEVTDRQGRHRTNEQIIDGMEENKDNPVYGSMFLKSMAQPQKFIQLYESQKHKYPKSKSIFSHILASASQIEGNGVDLATTITNGLLTGNPGNSDQLDHLPALNEMLHDETTKFGTNFLITMADNSRFAYPKDANINLSKEYPSPLYYDVHNGALNAMGRNPVAATKYLYGVDHNGVYNKELVKARWDGIRNRKTLDQEDATSAMKAASTLRTDKDYGEQATSVTALSLKYAADNIPKWQYTDKVKKNVSVMVANCPEEVHNIANGQQIESSLQIPMPEGVEGAEAQMKVNRNTISTVIYNVIDNKDAAVTISSAVGHHAIDNKSNLGTFDGLTSKYREAGADIGYLEHIANMRFNDNKANKQDTENTSNATGGAFRTVIGSLLPKGFDIAWNIGTSIADAVDANNLKDKNGNKIDVDKVPPISSEEYLKNLAITEAVNSGLIKADPNVSIPQKIRKEGDEVETSTVTIDITDSEGKVIVPNEYDATNSAALNTFKTNLEGSEKKLSNAIDDVDEAAEGARNRFAKDNNVNAGGIVISKGR
jgi:hypothetical protein